MMSPLQIGLIVVGVLLLLGVWAYQRWQTRRAEPRRVPTPPPVESPGDATDGRREPTLGSDAAPVDGAPTAAVAGVLCERLDAIVPLRLDKTVSGDAVLQVLPGSRRIGSKPFVIEGLAEDASSDDAWEQLRPGQRYRALRAGIQLANRAGPLNEIEYSEFAQKLQVWAEQLHAAADLPDMLTVVQRARELDQFAAAHDAQLTLTVRARRAAWNPGYVMQHAARLGFVPGALPGRMVLPASAPGAAPVLVLQFETQAALSDDPELAVLREVRLTLEATHVERGEQPYRRLRELSNALAAAMDGWVSDDAGQALDPAALEHIGGELEMLYEALEARGFPAGSAQARRLFG